MTKLQALRECYKMWSELAENGKNHKPDTFMENNCPMCQYTLDKYGRQSDIFCSSIKCSKCPLLSLWGYKSRYDTFAPCERDKSPYSKWRINIGDAGALKRQKYALIIADFCKNEIKKMKKGV